ncbi:hypothetical protein ACLB2K_047765 [Fragaria x ananassa]
MSARKKIEEQTGSEMVVGCYHSQFLTLVWLHRWLSGVDIEALKKRAASLHVAAEEDPIDAECQEQVPPRASIIMNHLIFKHCPTRPSPSPSSWSLTAKEQLISLITSIASADSSLRKCIRRAADDDVSHRKIFVQDLGWDTTREVFVSAFEPFVEDSNLVMDKLTGKAKGNGFALFKTCRAALKALREPKKTIGSRCASCQLTTLTWRHRRLNHGPVERFKEG